MSSSLLYVTSHCVEEDLHETYMFRLFHSEVSNCSPRRFSSSPHDKLIHVFLDNTSIVLSLEELPQLLSEIFDNIATLLYGDVAGVTGVELCLIVGWKKML